MRKKSKTELPTTQALIYCRVSSVGQRTEGHGLEGQEQRCREFAQHKGLEVDAVFLDTITGDSEYTERDALRKLIKYLDTHTNTRYTVIFDDLKRLARNTAYYLDLRLELAKRDVVMLSPNFTFEDSPEGNFIETIVVATGELERKQNARQVRQKTEALIRSGFYAFTTPRGYERGKDSSGQLCHVRKEPEASLIQEALEGYATGRFKVKADVHRFLLENNFNNGKVREEWVHSALTNILYAGFMNYEKWGIEMQKIRIEPLISLETFQIIEEKLSGKIRNTERKDIREEYPLRGLIICSECLTPMTASLTRKYNGYERDYYRCKKVGCRVYSKGTTIEKVHTEFEQLLSSFGPKDIVLNLVQIKFEECWKSREQLANTTRVRNIQLLKNIELQTENLLERLSRTNSESLINVYEQRVETLNYEKELLLSKSGTSSSSTDFGTALEEVMGFFKSPYDYYRTGDVYDKRLAFELVFMEKIPFEYQKGFGTINYSYFVKVFQQIVADSPVGCAYRDLNPN